MKNYDPKSIEPKWQQVWADTKLYAAIDGDKSRPKYYMLTEFPYPSGDGLHAGHTREYTLGDVIARHKRMQGYNVLFPMGYDAFGLPTENYAIKHKIKPQVATAQNVATFRKQFDSLGFSFDWDRQVNTTNPSYYRWTQWLFLQFLKAGLAYQDEIAINWCPKEKTGLANEEVVNGVHERCGTPVEKKLLKQWMLGITKYADRLIEGLKTVDYPPRIADQQVNWIGRSVGAEITWAVCDKEGKEDGHTLATYTTRKDTIPGVTFIVVAPDAPAIKDLIAPAEAADVLRYRESVAGIADLERQETKSKTGVPTGKYAKNPFNGDIIPIYAADYVLASYGTGVVMGMPGHDLRDREFAIQHNLPVILTTQPPTDFPIEDRAKVYSGGGKQINTGPGYDGLDREEAAKKILEVLEASGLAKPKTNYKLRDWIFSRQHYWGEPIPVIHCPHDGAVPVPEDQLPVTLPDVEHYEPTDSGESPLAAISDWVNTKCPKCDGPAKRETDTMPNWAGSSWYYLRYMDARNDHAFADPEKLKYWGMVDLYLGGMEHTTLHLLYARFWHQFLFDQKLVPTPEPFAARRGQGIVLAADGRKMSKSLGNVVNPTSIIARYGADSLRLYIMFMAPYDETTPWSDERLNGVSRFLYRVWALSQELLDSSFITPESVGYENSLGAFEVEIDRATHHTLKKVHDDFEGMRFNTVISALMEYINVLTAPDNRRRLLQENALALRSRTLRSLILLLAPAAPHIAEELWHQLGETESVHIAPWPSYDPELIKEDFVTVVIQVNGKVRAQLAMPAGATDAELTEAALADPNTMRHIDGKEVLKTIVVPRKLVNFVVK